MKEIFTSYLILVIYFQNIIILDSGTYFFDDIFFENFEALYLDLTTISINEP